MTDQLIRTPLWKHQIEDLDYLSEQAHVLQGSDMGSGKTKFALERDLRLRALDEQHTKTLVIAPLNTFDGWIENIQYETDLKLSVIDPKERHKFLAVDADIYLMHPQALRLMPELRDFGFDHVIADECQMFKNRKAAQTKALWKIRCVYKTAMSGSPATNRPHDLWAILHWLKPKEWSSYWNFYKSAVDFEIIYPGGYHKTKGPTHWWKTEGLAKIRPWYVRRLKEEVMPNLPQKVYNELKVDLEVEQRRAYNEMRDDMLAWVGEHHDQPLPAPAVISRLQRLQMLALAYMEFNEETGKFVMREPSPKLDAVQELIETAEETSFVVFSQFKAPLNMLARRLEKVGIGYGSYTGDDSRDDRAAAKAAFVGRDVRVFLSTIKAGGVGVDGLQHVCSTGIFLDRDWDPMVNKQAEDRLHRGGQVHSVHIIDVMARNTVDAGRKTTISTKHGWVKETLGDL